jgi:hypothetical protein
MKIMRWLFILFTICLFASTSFAATKVITFAWDQELPIPNDLGGWRVYSSTVSGGPYSTLVTTITPYFIPNLGTSYSRAVTITVPDNASTTLYFAFKAFDTSVPANESGFSNQVPYTFDFIAPSIVSIAPSVTQAGSGAFTLTVTGTNFTSGSIVKWNGVNRTTTFVSATQLTAAILAADIATAGVVNVTVLNTNGVESLARTFTVTSPAPGAPSNLRIP